LRGFVGNLERIGCRWRRRRRKRLFIMGKGRGMIRMSSSMSMSMGISTGKKGKGRWGCTRREVMVGRGGEGSLRGLRSGLGRGVELG
jgi:hypothetical protein